MEDAPDTITDSNTLLRLSVQCLTQRNFLGCRKYAVRAIEAEPSIAGADEILAVADVLRAAERRLRNHHIDYYSVLQVGRLESANLQLVWAQFEKLVTLVNPKKNKLPFSQEAYSLLCQAWSLLSDPQKKAQYDMETGDGDGDDDDDQADKGTFWTVCPYCYCMFEYWKVYEDFCLRCQECRRAFHGVAINRPSQEIMVPGKDQYYFCYGVFPIGYSEGNVKVNGFKGEENDNKGKGDEEVVEISDDDDGDAQEEDTSGDYLRRSMTQKKSSDSFTSLNSEDKEGFDGFSWEEVVKNGNGVDKDEIFAQEIGKIEATIDGKWPKKIKAPARRMKNVKSVALNTKKMVGNWTRNWGSESVEAMGIGNSEANMDIGKEIDEAAGGPSDVGLAFFDGDDDILVGFADIP